MLRSAVRVFAFLLVLAWPLLAAAQSSDVVMLTNGGRLRGTVEVYVPGSDLVILLPDGTRRTVPAAEVASVTFGDAPPVDAPPADAVVDEPFVAPPPSTPPPTTPPPTGPVIIGPAPGTPPPGSPPYGTPYRAPPGGYGPPEGGGPMGMPEVQAIESSDASAVGIPEGSPRTYTPDRPEGATWTDDPARGGLPDGMFHIGVELRGMARISGSYFRGTQPYGGLDLGVTCTLRLATWFHIRAGIVFGLHTGEDAGGGFRQGTGLGLLGVRARIAFDIARLFSLRLGGTIGGEWIAQYERAGAYGVPEVDIVGQLTDEGRLEIGVSFGMPFHEACDNRDPRAIRCDLRQGFQIQVLVGALFL